jgi:hypothetical protein
LSIGAGVPSPPRHHPDFTEPQADPQRSESAQPAKKLRTKLKWVFVLGWPVLYISAFVASTIVHDPAKEQSLYLGGTSEAEDVLFIVGVVGLVTWIVGCLVLIVAAVVAENSAKADGAR